MGLRFPRSVVRVFVPFFFSPSICSLSIDPPPGGAAVGNPRMQTPLAPLRTLPATATMALSCLVLHLLPQCRRSLIWMVPGGGRGRERVLVDGAALGDGGVCLR
uniref:Putative secreted protein n=1 Tax=Anopheles triannulatus TaxID=58253 RepID=A0A2M4B459_9DIPT